MRLGFLVFLVLLLSCSTEKKNEPDGALPRNFSATKANTAPEIDGVPDDACWDTATWYPMDQDWINKPWSAEDFSGRYKISWDEEHIYVLAEIQDDTLIDIHEDGLKKYWDDDCLEIFIDEDRSGGNHQYNHNAFAYHIALDYKVADIGPDSLAHYYDHHIHCKRTQQGNTSYWEVAMRVYTDEYLDGRAENPTVILQKNKLLGFAIAYCDNDHSTEREHFIGSTIVEGEDKNRGWIDAGIFGPLTLK
ncbi:MAG: sugar-binding protein [Saprospiraceae bacterium]|nr:sugar-binding protein [Saprospiraceae bacterium]